MCSKYFKKQSNNTGEQLIPAQAVAASSEPVSASVKGRDSNADLRSDVTNAPSVGGTNSNSSGIGTVDLGVKKKRKKIVGIDL